MRARHSRDLVGGKAIDVYSFTMRQDQAHSFESLPLGEKKGTQMANPSRLRCYTASATAHVINDSRRILKVTSMLCLRECSS